MQFQKLLKFPALLRSARTQSGVAQKVVALGMGIDQAHYCGVEKGRRPPFGDSVIDRLGAALQIGCAEVEELRWAARHDRYLRLIYDAAESWDDAWLVSSVLSASRQLDTPQRSGLCDYLNAIEASAGQVRALALRGHPSFEAKGAAMT